MTHEERVRLIRLPFPTVRVHTSSHGWAGVLIRDSVPTEGRRTFHLEPEDEAMIAKMTKERE